MPHWDELFRRMRRLEAQRQETEARKAALQASNAANDAWAEQALAELWQAVIAEVRRRAEEFRLETGCRIDVGRRGAPSDCEQMGFRREHDSRPRPDELERPAALPALRVLELQLATSLVYIYTHHVSGSAPLVHLAHWPAPSPGHRHHHRMMSLSVCVLERTEAGSWGLRRVLSPGDELRVENLVYLAFELLVLGLDRREEGSPSTLRSALTR